MDWLQRWISNRPNQRTQHELVNPIDATNAANKWRDISESLGYDPLDTPKFDTTEIIEGITGGIAEKTKNGENILDNSGLPGNNDIDTTTTVTEGPDTKLVQTEDGTVMRVPVDQDIIGSTTIQVDDQAPIGEVDYEAIPKEEDQRQGETEKAAWLYKTRNSPAAKAGHSDERRWSLHLKNKAFQLAKKNKTLDQFVKDYPNSPYSKERLRRKRR